MKGPSAIRISGVSYRYRTRSGERLALDDLSLEIPEGQCFALLGPNGGGKTTLFRLLSTLIAPQTGQIEVGGHDLLEERQQVQAKLGVVFQAASLDRKLTVNENLRLQGTLYGISREEVQQRSADLLRQLGLADRGDDFAEALSGGQRRRVEVAKGLIHQPELLLLDEPTTGLDPGVRSDLWRYLLDLQQRMKVTIVFTTHLLEEAERADQIGILNQGKLVALDSPQQLKQRLGGEVVSVRTHDNDQYAAAISEACRVETKCVEDEIRIAVDGDARDVMAMILDKYRKEIISITLSQPTLEDVFIKETGHEFWSA